MTSICENKISAEVRFIHAKQFFLRISSFYEKNRHSWRLSNSSKVF